MRKQAALLGLTLVLLVSAVVSVAAEEPLVNLFLFDTDLREALSEISLQTGINIIPDATVSGVVTADLQDVPLEKAFRMILIGGGFAFKKIDDFYFVGLPDPRSTTFSELVDTEVVRLRHATSDQIIAALPAFLSPYVQAGYDSRIVTISAPPAELERIKDLIQAVDQPQQQIEIQVIVTEVSTDFFKDFGSKMFSYSMQAGQSKNDDWTGSLDFDGSALSLVLDVYGTLLSQLKLAEQNQEAKVHADPKIVVAEGSSAELFIGDRQIVMLSAAGDNISRVERIDVGVSLKVTPRIVGDDEIMLTIAPEMSHFVNEAKPDIIVKQSSVSTTIKVQDRQTAMLVGMSMQDSGDYSRKVPILGDIPLIRWFFRSDIERTRDKELLIFVTPTILETGGF